MFVAWKSASFMQPANCDITRSAAAERVSPPPVGVLVCPLRSSTSFASHLVIASFSVASYVLPWWGLDSLVRIGAEVVKLPTRST